MKTISLRFAENFAPSCGTIKAHQTIIDKKGYVWYGKLGACISDKVIKSILDEKIHRILLINSGKQDRYWAYYEEIKKETPELDGIPEYYRNDVSKFKTWFKIVKIDNAPKDVISYCSVVSSGNPLSEASKRSMNPYFYINYEGE